MNDDQRRQRASSELRELLPYFIPYLLFWPFQYANALSPNAMYVTYPVKIIVIAIALICFRRQYPELRWKCSVHAVWVGLAACAVWIVPYWKLVPVLPAPPLGSAGFNPLQFHDNPVAMWGLVAFRVGGAALVVPFVEELLFRSCVARLVIDQDFRNVPVGRFTLASLAITTAAFALGHRPWEWAAAILVGGIYYGLIVWRRNILDCIVAHGITNLSLGIYVLTTHQWFWW